MLWDRVDGFGSVFDGRVARYECPKRGRGSRTTLQRPYPIGRKRGAVSRDRDGRSMLVAHVDAVG